MSVKMREKQQQSHHKKKTIASAHTITPAPKRSRSRSLAQRDAQPWLNQVYRRAITCDVMRAFYKASSPRAMLHSWFMSSRLNAKILYCNIPIANAILNDVEDDGFLIDLNLAIKLAREKALRGTQTKLALKSFMAI
ncbi:hypothetical protein MMC31_002345 [Peltigera leucophlebia]|nr:hypothetical protein [Peltigera leucophlebia]